jgi:chemotaxis protein histidine kinase CheA
MRDRGYHDPEKVNNANKRTRKGKVGLHTHPGKGSTFTVTLPR